MHKSVGTKASIVWVMQASIVWVMHEGRYVICQPSKYLQQACHAAG
jgi:hypothetical protein